MSSMTAQSFLRVLCATVLATSALAQSPQPAATHLAALAAAHDPTLAAAITSAFNANQLQAGTAAASHGPDFFFAVDAASQPTLLIDNKPGPQTQQAAPGLWYAVARIDAVGRAHSFAYVIDGKPFGGSVDLPAFDPLSYLQPGVPSGTLSAKLVHTSKICDGMKSDYWIYVPAQYDPKVPAALMVFQDGGGYIHRDGNRPALNVIDNLIAQHKIPVMICIFINPGTIDDSPGTPTYNAVKAYSEKWRRTMPDSMRSNLYDTVSDRYDRFLRDEIIPTVAARYNLRKDAYSRAITGSSSGGICAFNAAWQMPDQFSRVISWIGSFTAIQWKETPGITEGGQDYPEKVLREDHRNIRVLLADGANDQENDRYGSWPLANIRLANALKLKGYDFHFSFGIGTHNQAHGSAMFPEEMIWLWRGYDAAKTEQVFEIDPAEKTLPPFRVSITNRDAN